MPYWGSDEIDFGGSNGASDPWVVPEDDDEPIDWGSSEDGEPVSEPEKRPYDALRRRR
jgi:hypothetical protein